MEVTVPFESSWELTSEVELGSLISQSLIYMEIKWLKLLKKKKRRLNFYIIKSQCLESQKDKIKGVGDYYNMWEAREDHSDEAAIEQRLDGSEGADREDVWRRSAPGWKNNSV